MFNSVGVVLRRKIQFSSLFFSNILMEALFKKDTISNDNMALHLLFDIDFKTNGLHYTIFVLFNQEFYLLFIRL